MLSFATQANLLVIVPILPAAGFQLDHHQHTVLSAEEEMLGITVCLDEEGCGTIAGHISFLCDSMHGDHIPCADSSFYDESNRTEWPGYPANLAKWSRGDLGRAFELEIDYQNPHSSLGREIPNQLFYMRDDNGQPNGFSARVFAKRDCDGNQDGCWNMPISFTARMKDNAKVHNAHWVHLNTGTEHAWDNGNYWLPGMTFEFSAPHQINYLDIVMAPTNSCRIHPTVTVREENGNLVPFQNNYSWKDSTGGLQFKYEEGKALALAGPPPLVRDFDNEGKATVWVEGMDNTQAFGNMTVTIDLVQLPDDLEVESNGCAVMFGWAFEESYCDIVLRHKKQQQPARRHHKFWGP